MKHGQGTIFEGNKMQHGIWDQEQHIFDFMAFLKTKVNLTEFSGSGKDKIAGFHAL